MEYDRTNESSVQVHMTEQIPTDSGNDIDTLHYIGHGFVVPIICALGILCNGLVIIVLLKKSLSQVSYMRVSIEVLVLLCTNVSEALQ